MSMGIRISDQLMKEARVISTVEHRSISGQIEYWAKIGKYAEDNPDLNLNLINEILIGLEQLDEGYGSEYKFG